MFERSQQSKACALEVPPSVGGVVAGFRLARVVKGVDDGGCVGPSGVGGDVVVGEGSVLVVGGNNIGDGVRCVGVGPLGGGGKC